MSTATFFIIGPPKSGTTALYSYLKEHPQVFMPAYDKEPHYFAKDLHAHSTAARYMDWKTDRAS